MVPPNLAGADFQHPETFLLEVPANLWRGIEAVGGRLTISTERLVFRAHAFNVQTAPLELAIAHIREIRKANSLKIIPNRMDVEMASGERYVFVVGRRNKTFDLLTRLIEERRAR